MPKADRLKTRHYQSPAFRYLVEVSKRHSLHSVCERLRCPNYIECWCSGTSTFLIMGSECTRNCRLCPLPTKRKPKRPDYREPWRLANAVSELALKYVVLTSVSRDDLSDGGAAHFARCISEIKRRNPETLVEATIPDFNAKTGALKKVINARPDVISHNVVVKRVTPHLKDRRAKYGNSIRVLKKVKEISPGTITKSSIMLGFRESWVEVLATMRHLRKTGVEILTIGQYRRSSKDQFPVREYVDTERFEFYEREAYRLGFKFVKAGTFVQSSYRAAEAFKKR